MDRSRLIVALALSLVVLISWPLAMRYLAPPPIDEPSLIEEPQPRTSEAPPSLPLTPNKIASPGPSAPAQPARTETTQVAQRDITVSFVQNDSTYWSASLSNRGAVATSWALEHYNDSGIERKIKGADGNKLQLIPHEIPEALDAPFGIRTPWSPDLGRQLNRLNFEIGGVEPAEKEITLGPNDSRTITFSYTSPTLKATKSFTFHGGSFVVDVSAKVSSAGSDQLVEIVLGPRFGDQTDTQTGSYSTPPQVVAYTVDGHREQILGASITPPFSTITAVNHEANQIDVDKPIAEGVTTVKLTADKGATFVGYSKVTARENNGHRITLESLPQGTSKGNGIGQGADTIAKLHEWAGVTDHYFAMLAIHDRNQPIQEVTLTNIQVKQGETVHDYPSAAIPVGSSSETHIFVGPKDRHILSDVSAKYGANLGALIDYGMFSFAVKPLVPPLAAALNAFRKLFGNYGWAIVAVTVLINLVLSPLRFYSSKKMKKAAKHQPRMKELQDRMKKLKENPKKYERELQELQAEQLALMKEANPLGGCMPLLLQMPIFWAVYMYLGSSLDVRHAPWVLWIQDLSRSDPLKILPIVMCITMIASTKLTPQPASADPSMKMQRVMMTWLMPIMLTWLFFFSAPSGLVLYWMVSNIVGVLIQLWINRKTADLTAEIAAANSSGGGKGGGGTQKGKNPKRRNERRGSAEAEGF